MTDRFLPEPVLAEIADRTGIAFELIEMADHGDSGGAAYVRWPDGREGVLTRPPATADIMRLSAEVLTTVRATGLPVPSYGLVVTLAGGGVAAVQDRLPGRHIRHVDIDTVEAMVAMNDRFAGLLADRPDVPVPTLWLRQSAPESPPHDDIESYSDRAAALIGRIRELDSEPGPDIVGDDLLHLDYARGNVLTDEHGRITGVVDWNLGVARGDRNFALVALRSDFEWRALAPDSCGNIEQPAVERLDRILEERIEPEMLRRYWAHWTLMKLHGVILWNEPDVVEVFLRLGEERIA
ncbi:MAG TPA: phosphotransferase [Mycobacteriales bacterium]|nr:phosphotransferase [Mycobacteriales bacterium]